MNINNVERTVLFDSINSRKLKEFRENWHNSRKVLPLYSVYEDYLNSNNVYLVYLGLNEVGVQQFSKITLPFNSDNLINVEDCSVLKIKLVNKNLLAFTKPSSLGSTFLVKRVKTTKDLETQIYNLIKNNYTDNVIPINSLNIGSVTTSLVSSASSYNKINLTELENDVNNLKDEIKKLKEEIDKISKKQP